MDELRLPYRVAVVLPVYNVSLYLEECLHSILNQTFSNFVVFAVDDGSTDKSGHILDEYARLDKRIRVIHKKNGGLSSARNAALRMVFQDPSFTHVSYIDSDDTVDDHFLESMLCAVSKYQCEYVECGVESFDTKGSVRFFDFTQDVLLKGLDAAYLFYNLKTDHVIGREMVMVMNKLYSISLIKNYYFDETLPVGEDQFYLLHVLLKVSLGCAVPGSLYKYRLRQSSLMNGVHKLRFEYLLKSIIITDLPEKIHHVVAKRLLSHYWKAVLYSRADIDTLCYSEKDLKLIFDEILRCNCSKEINTPKWLLKRFMMRFCGKIFDFLAKSSISKKNAQINYRVSYFK